MSYLLDTNVLSETVRKSPAKSVLRWIESVPNDMLFISVLTLGEIRKGVEGVSDKRRRERLRLWLERDMVGWFGGRVLPVSVDVADRWGRLVASVGRPVPAIDSLLAATALHHELRMVTRNVADFAYPGIEVFNPWEE